MPVRYFKYDQPFALENGEKLPELTIAYHTFGTFKGNNAVWVCHALTANSDVATGGRIRSNRAGFSTRSVISSSARTSSARLTDRPVR